MAETQDISTALKRTLKAGKEYSKLIPRVSCKQTPLGAGDTYYTVDQMRGWIEKFRHQTAKLSLTIEGHTLQETVNNIYQFLYDHVQYTADGALQQLRSPACTWAQRKQGVDCKSFSVFASSLLYNLGIVHAIRQVRQPYFYPEEFTHVYVVVPVDQSKDTISPNAPTFVLDATRHENTEVEFIEKADLHMNKLTHVGLNAPQDERTKNIIENFDKFCNHLIENGIPVATVKEISEQVNLYTSRGLDPKFQIVRDGIKIQDKYFELNFNKDQEYEKGLGFVATATAAVTAGKKLLDMLPGDFIGSTFGAIFANGFDMSCWNASYSESKAQEALTTDIPFFLEWSGLSKNPTTQALNKFSNAMYSYIDDAINGQRSKFAKCTREGYAARQKGTEEALQKVINTLENSGLKVIRTGETKGYVRIENVPSFGGKVYEWGKNTDRQSTYDYVTYRLEDDYNNTPPSNNTGGGSTGGGSNYQPGNNNGGSTDSNGDATAKKSGSNTGIIIGGVALAALPFLLPMMKKSPVAKPKPKAKTKTKKTAK